MTVKETELKTLGVNCIYDKRLFLAADGKDASKELTNELDKRGTVEQPGTLIFEYACENEERKIKLEAIFRGIIYRRTFVTIYNNEAFNMLMNKLSRKGIFRQQGRLAFEFIPGATTNWLVRRSEIDSQICVCGHSRFAHLYVYGRWGRDRGRCDVTGCKCVNYIPKPKEVPKEVPK